MKVNHNMKILNVFHVARLDVIEMYNEENNLFEYYVRYVGNANMYYSFGTTTQYSLEQIRNLIFNGYFDGLSEPSLDDIGFCEYKQIEEYLLNDFDEDREEAPTKVDVIKKLMNNPYDIIYGLICEIEELNKVIDKL